MLLTLTRYATQSIDTWDHNLSEEEVEIIQRKGREWEQAAKAPAKEKMAIM